MWFTIPQTFARAFDYANVRRRLFYTCLVMAVFRLSAFVPVPGVDTAGIQTYLKGGIDSFGIGIFNLFTGGGFANGSVGALGVFPVVCAMAVMQLLKGHCPAVRALANSNAAERKLEFVERGLTLCFALVQSILVVHIWIHPEKTLAGFHATGLGSRSNGLLFLIGTTLFLTAGAMISSWLVRQVTKHGIGGAASLAVAIGLLHGIPPALTELSDLLRTGWNSNLFIFGFSLAAILGGIVGMVALNMLHRKTPVHFMAQTIRKREVPAVTSNFPIILPHLIVWPLLSAQCLLLFSYAILSVGSNWMDFHWIHALAEAIGPGSVLNLLIIAILVVLLIDANHRNLASSMSVGDWDEFDITYPEKPEKLSMNEYIASVARSLSFSKSLLMAAIAVVPVVLIQGVTTGFYVRQFTTGFGFVILAGVAMECLYSMNLLETMEYFSGLLSKSGDEPTPEGESKAEQT